MNTPPAIQLDVETYALLDELARQRGCTPTDLVRTLIEEEGERAPISDPGLSTPAQDLLASLAQHGSGLLTAASYRGQKLYYAGNTSYPKANSSLSTFADVQDAIDELRTSAFLELHADGNYQLTLAGLEAAHQGKSHRGNSNPPLPQRPKASGR